MKNWSLFLLIVLLCLLSFVGGRKSRKVTDSVTTIDTLVVRDTIRIEKPLTKFVKTTDTMLLAVTDTIVLHDTAYVRLPIETKVYQDSTYKAQVSGYKPSLDFIEVYPITTTISKTNVVYKAKKTRWGLGVSVGYGVTMNGGEVNASPYVGVGISYNLWSW